MTLVSAQALSGQIVSALSPFCDMIEVAGSVRRRRPVCNDIDIVALPKSLEAFAAIKSRCLEKASLITDGEEIFAFELADATHVEIYFAHHEQNLLFAVEPCNWGTMLLCRTGSKEHNMELCRRAKSMGLHWAPHRGLMKDADIVASATEEEVFDALKLPFVNPENREIR